jgi:hypothetical protein
MDSVKVAVKVQTLKKFLDLLKFPLFFLDYETYTFDEQTEGFSTSQLPFQYSLHRLDSPDQFEPSQTMYLHSEASSPLEPLMDQLLDDIGEEGSILVWNDKFEKKCNRLMAEQLPDKLTEMSAINLRIVDLADPYKNEWIWDRRISPRWSLKVVLPSLFPTEDFPELDYHALDLIQEGGAAQKYWTEGVFLSDPRYDKTQILESLRAYCSLDTLAMVYIYRKYRELVGRVSG